MSNNLDKQYLDLIEEIMVNGSIKKDRTGTGTLSVFGRQIRHKMKVGFPLLTTKKMHFKSIVTELLWFLRGDTNIKYLLDNDCYIWVGDAYKNYCKYDHYEAGNVTINDDKSFEREVVKINISQEEFIEKIKTDDEFAQKWGDLGRVYGAQWRRWKGKAWTPRAWLDENGNPVVRGANNIKVDYSSLDQITNLINDLRNNPDSRRMLVTAWNPVDVPDSVLPPCHIGFQLYTRELSLEERLKWMKQNKSNVILPTRDINVEFSMDEYFRPYGVPSRAISLMWNQRSVDTPLGLPFNIASYGLLLEIIARMVNMVPEELIGNLGDTHIYSNQAEGVKEQLSRTGYQLPTLEIAPHVNFSGSIDDFLASCTKEDFTVVNYVSHPTIKFPLSN